MPSLQISNSNKPRVTWEHGLQSANHTPESVAHLHSHPNAAASLLPEASGIATPPPWGELSSPPVQPTRHRSPCFHSTFFGQLVRLSDFTFTFHFHALEEETATHSSVLAWRIPGMGEPGELPSLGSHRVGLKRLSSSSSSSRGWTFIYSLSFPVCLL